MKAYQRNIFLINRPFQIKFSLFVCSWIFALSLLYPLVITNLFEVFFRQVSQDPLGPPLTKIQQTKTEFLFLLGLFQVVFLAITFLISIRVSHQIAGPLYKIKKTIMKMKLGDLNHEIHLRKNDHFQDLATEFNEMTKGLRSILSKNHDRLDATISKLELIQSQGGQNVKQDLESALALLREIREQNPK